MPHAFCTIHAYSLSLHHHRYVDCAVGAACTASGGVAHAAQPVSLAHAHNSTWLRDSVRQATSQVQRHSRDVGGNRAGPSSREEAGVLQPLLHRTQETWWPSTNPGSASSEPGFTQAPVQDADAQAHYQMHPALGLVCSDRPEGCLLSCFDPSATPNANCRNGLRSGMAVQGPPLRALPVSPCAHEGRRRRPYPVTGGGCQDPQLPRRLAYPSQLGLRVNWEKSKLSPVQRISFLGVELDSVSMTACLTEERAQAVLNCLSSFRGRNVVPSEAPGAYGIRSFSHATRIASYEATSALATLLGPEAGMAPRYTASGYHPAVLRSLSP